MESWRKVWREGIASLLSTQSLLALKEALDKDDPALIQGATITPPPLQCVQDWPVEAACPIAYAGWQDGEGRDVVADVEEFFARVCFECDQLMEEPAACRHFLCWWDNTPRNKARLALLEEVNKRLEELPT